MAVVGEAPRKTLFGADIDVQFEFDRGGWQVITFGSERGEFIELEDHAQYPESRAGVALVLWMPGDPINAVASWFANYEYFLEATEPVTTTFAGHEAYRLDVLAGTPPEAEDEGPCWGGPVLVGGFYRLGISACMWTRIWVVDVEGVTVTVFGNAGWFDEDLDPDRVWQIEEILPHLEDFEDAITFCTEATPCDGPAPDEG